MNNVRNKFLFIIFILLLGCSFGLGGNVWNDLSEELEKQKQEKFQDNLFNSKKFEDEIENNKKILIESQSITRIGLKIFFLIIIILIIF